jgi:hemolysin D
MEFLKDWPQILQQGLDAFFAALQRSWHWLAAQGEAALRGGAEQLPLWQVALPVTISLAALYVLYRSGLSLRGAGQRSDREFLPAALSILETPPSPVKVRLIWAICGLFAFVIGWSYFGRIDIIAVAQGKIQPTGRVKTIQPVEGGKVVAIHAENGKHVEAGAVLIELDAEETRADYENALAALLGYRAERLRRLAALGAVEADRVDTETKVAWPSEIPEAMRAREDLVLRGDLRQLAVNVKSLDAQLFQKKAEQKRLAETMAAQQVLIATLSERVTMRSTLQATQAGTKAAVIDAQETLQIQETALATQKGQLAEAIAAAEVLTQERLKAIETFKAENGQKLADAGRQIDDYAQKTAKTGAKLSHMTIKSPAGGVVLGLSVTTLGQVVSPSEEIMRIVPDGTGLEIEAYVENKDIGFVAAGQPAIVKIESFPFTRYGVLDAKVVRVAHDAIPEPDTQTVEGNPAKTTKSSFFGGAQRTQNLVFPVTLTLSRLSMDIDGAPVALRPGMAASVEVKTGKRRILEYVFSPLVETVSKSMKER